MNDKKIEDQIRHDYNEFLRKDFPEDIPGWVLEMLALGVMEMNQQQQPWQADRITTILSKKPSELTIFEVGIITNILTSVAPKCFNIDLKTFLERKKVLEYISMRWNQLTKGEEERLDRKAIALQNMGGKNGTNLSKVN